MVCSKCEQKFNPRLQLLPSMFCKCGGIFLPARTKKPKSPDDPAVIAYRRQFEEYLEEQEKPRPWNRWSGSIYHGSVIRETPKAIHMNLDSEEDPKWAPKSVIDLEFSGDEAIDVWIPDWIMALPKNELLDLIETMEWTLPASCLPPKSL